MVFPVDKIRGLYLSEKYYADPLIKYYKEDHKRIFADIDSINGLEIKNLSIKSLEKLISQDASKANILSRLLASMPSERIFEEFGEEALFWTMNQYMTSRRTQILEDYCRLTGKNGFLIEKARTAACILENSNNSLEIYKLYELFTGLDDALKTLDLKKTLLEFSSNKENISQILDRYALHKIETMGDLNRGYDQRWYNPTHESSEKPERKMTPVYLDTPIGVALTYENKPVAATTFMVTEKDKLMTYQIQGVREKIINKENETIKVLRTKGLFDLEWRKMLVNINEQIASYFDIKTCGVLSGHHNRWTYASSLDSESKPHLDIMEALRIYDDTARESGYKQKRKGGDWYKRI